MTQPPDSSEAWRAHVRAGLAEHVARGVDDLLPDGDEVVAVGTHLVLTRRNGSGPARTVVTKEMTPVHAADAPEQIAERLLDDLQDMIIGTLHRPWPEGDSGRALHPWARRRDDRVEIGFAGRDGTDGVTLLPFPVPSGPGRVVDAG